MAALSVLRTDPDNQGQRQPTDPLCPCVKSRPSANRQLAESGLASSRGWVAAPPTPEPGTSYPAAHLLSAYVRGLWKLKSAVVRGIVFQSGTLGFTAGCTAAAV